MRKSLVSIFSLVLIVFLSACKDDVQIEGAPIESAVVIGLLNQYETTHYIKITRTFIGDGETSALDIAKIPDSSYFDQVDVTIQEILSDGTVGRLFALHDTLIENKDENGVFYAPKQKVYVFYTTESAPLLDDATYQLKAVINGGEMIVTGETRMVSGMSVANVGNTNYAIKLTKSGDALGEYSNHTINMDNVGNAYKVSATVRFNYREFSVGLTDSTDKFIDFYLGEFDVEPGFNTTQTFSFSGETFYQTLKDKIPVSASVEKRINTSFEFFFTGADQTLSNYMEVNQPSSSIAQNKPSYTNLEITEGHKVIGIFAARQTIQFYKPATALSSIVQTLNKKSRKELCIGPLTGNLSFCSRHTSDAAPIMESWYCN